MTRAKHINAWAWDLAAVVAMLAIGAPTTRAAVTVTQTPNRVTLENESGRVVFDAKTNYVPTELIYKPGSGRNLIVDNFCLYYQFVQNGAIASVNEGYPGGRISNGRYKLEEKDGAATVEYRCDTPHFHMTRRVSVPATGPAVKFAYELECTQADSFSFSLPYAPLSPTLNRRATHIDFIESDGRTPGRIIVEEAKSPRLPTGVPFSRTECYFNDQTGEGLVFAHISEESSAGISQRDTPRFDAGMKERCDFTVTYPQSKCI